MTEYLHSGENGRWGAIREALAELDAPTTAAELGVDDEELIAALTTAHEIRDRYTILQGGINEEAAIEVASATGVIER
jgi:glycerol-1-phosphate dehydrogenase [NAD(P)+]